MSFWEMYRTYKRRLGLLKSIAIYNWKPFNQRRLRRFYAQFINPGDLCFDVGAHVGNRTIAWARMGARVIAVEPQPLFAAYLRSRFRRQQRVTVRELGVSADVGTGILHINSANPTISTLSDSDWRGQLARDAHYPISWDDSDEIELTTLDALIAEYGVPAFCKLDVENYEYEALMGLSAPIPLLSFEYYPPRIAGALKCLDRLREIGDYEYNWSFGESLALNSPHWLEYQDIKEILAGYKSRYEYGDVYARNKVNS
jgi:FkbM family methyltransferase